MTPAKRSRARAHKNSDYESPDECEFSNLHSGPSGSGPSSNEVIRLVQHAPIARGTTAEAGKLTQRRCILTILGKAPPPPKPMVRGRGTAKRKQHRIQGLSECADEFMRMVEQKAGFSNIYEDLAQM
jgi:hypothetical protein